MRDGRDHDLQHKLVHLTPINPYSQRQDELRNVVRKRVGKPRTPEIHTKPAMPLNEKSQVILVFSEVFVYSVHQGFSIQVLGVPPALLI